MNRNEIVEAWAREEREPFIGWDFAHLDGRMIEEKPPWSYSARAGELMPRSSSVIDLGTGGGERLLELRGSWPKKVTATEAYPPNFALATRRLSPYGVRVADVEQSGTTSMPFEDGEFDLALNRHSGFNAGEVGRILSSGGVFLTQQIHGLSAQDLLAAFDAKPQWPDAGPEKYIPLLSAAGFAVVEVREWSGRLSFTDVGAIVYYLRAVPWLVPGFSVKTHMKSLLALQHRLEMNGKLDFTARKYLIEAKKTSG